VDVSYYTMKIQISVRSVIPTGTVVYNRKNDQWGLAVGA